MNTQNRNLLIGGLLLGGAILYFRNRANKDPKVSQSDEQSEESQQSGGGGGGGIRPLSSSKPTTNVATKPTSIYGGVVTSLKKVFDEANTLSSVNNRSVEPANSVLTPQYTNRSIAPITTRNTQIANRPRPIGTATTTIQNAGISPTSASSTYSFFDVDGDDNDFDAFID